MKPLLVIGAILFIIAAFAMSNPRPSVGPAYDAAARHYEDMAAESLRLQEKRDESLDRFLRNH